MLYKLTSWHVCKISNTGWLLTLDVVFMAFLYGENFDLR